MVKLSVRSCLAATEECGVAYVEGSDTVASGRGGVPRFLARRAGNVLSDTRPGWATCLSTYTN